MLTSAATPQIPATSSVPTSLDLIHAAVILDIRERHLIAARVNLISVLKWFVYKLYCWNFNQLILFLIFSWLKPIFQKHGRYNIENE